MSNRQFTGIHEGVTMSKQGPLSNSFGACQEKLFNNFLLAGLFLCASSAALATSPAWAQGKASAAEHAASKSIGVELNLEAPDFDLPSAGGGRVRLSDFRGKRIVVVYFYPKDDTPICTKESCAFKDSYEVFKNAGAEVVGISSDSLDSHKQFADEHELPFILLSDEGGKVRKRWGVPDSAPGKPGRVTYVIDYSGKVKNIFNAPQEDQKHVDEALKVVNEIKSQSSFPPTKIQ
jgi:peroxiredoxin Q/BCP